MTLESIEYKGLTIRIEPDSDASSPFEMSEDVRLVGWHRRYANPTPEFDTPDEVVAYARESGAHLLKVYMYDHSGTAYRLGDANPFSCPWDSGWFGFLIVEKAYLDGHKWKRVTAKRHALLLDWMAGFMEEYTAWVNGWGCGYVIEDADGEELDSCWGYLDQDYCVEAAKEAADCHVRSDAA